MFVTYHIAEMKETDWLGVADIYKQGIDTKISTFQTEVPTYKVWDEGHIQNCRFVAKEEDKVVGFVAISQSFERYVYRGVVELSIYVHKDYEGKGIASALLEKLIIESEKEGFWTLESLIIRENEASIALHKKCGFREVGYRERFGQMDNGKWHDVVIMERRIAN